MPGPLRAEKIKTKTDILYSPNYKDENDHKEKDQGILKTKPNKTKSLGLPPNGPNPRILILVLILLLILGINGTICRKAEGVAR